MNDYAIYEATTGRLIRNGSTGGDIQAKPLTGEGVIAGHIDGETQYVVSGAATARPAANFSPLSASISEDDVRTLTGLPDGAVVTVTRPEGADLSATVGSSGEMAITFSDAGQYTITATAAFPFKTSEVTVDVNA